jgi:hypothetical protein
MKLILKSLVVCLALFAAYHVALKRLPARLRSGNGAGSQPERNLIAAENYLYTSKNPPVVVVGSSIAERLHDLPADWYQLTFPGGNVFTGMEIILRSGKRPRYVLVEANVLNMDPDRQMLDTLSYPVLKDVRNKFPALLEQNKPSHVLVRALHGRGAQKSESASAAGADPVSAAFFDELVRRRLNELSEPPSPQRLDEIMARLHAQVDALQKRGIQVIFFEVPELAQAEDRPLKATIRERVQREFPEPKYHWIPMPDATAYRTTDAVHLTSDSARRYCAVMSGYLASVGSRPTEGEAKSE